MMEHINYERSRIPMSENEFILILRNELQPIKDEIRETQTELQDFRIYVENEIEPKIQLLAENYMPAAKRYERTMPEIKDIKCDIDIIKNVLAEHTEKLEHIAACN